MNPVTLTVAAFGARVEQVLVAEPGYAWYRCRDCGEVQYRARRDAKGRCVMTPGCPGKVDAHVEALCPTCGGVVTKRSKDGIHCTRRCAA